MKEIIKVYLKEDGGLEIRVLPQEEHPGWWGIACADIVRHVINAHVGLLDETPERKIEWQKTFHRIMKNELRMYRIIEGDYEAEGGTK